MRFSASYFYVVSRIRYIRQKLFKIFILETNLITIRLFLFNLSLHTVFARIRDRKTQANVKKYGKQPMRNQKNQAPIKNRDASVTVRPDWNTIEEMDFPRLSKLSLPNVKEAEDM